MQKRVEGGMQKDKNERCLNKMKTMELISKMWFFEQTSKFDNVF